MIDERLSCRDCGACVAICPTRSITMIDEGTGYRNPLINKNTCISCEKCSLVCQLKRKSIQYIQAKRKAFIYRESNILNSNSSSGGFCFKFAEAFISNGGVVYAASFVQVEGVVKHIRITNLEQLESIRGSKYTKSNQDDLFSFIKKDLDKGISVCYYGMPCEIIGLQLFLGKSYANLVTISIACGGSVSSDYFAIYVRELEKSYHGKLENINFRDKKNQNTGYLTSIVVNGKKHYVKKKEDSFIRFLSSRFVKPSCKLCNINQKESFSTAFVSDYHNQQYPHRTLVMFDSDDHLFNATLEILSKDDYIFVDLFSSQDAIQISCHGASEIIEESDYRHFFTSLKTSGTLKTFKRFIFASYPIRAKISYHMPKGIKKIIYGKKK